MTLKELLMLHQMNETLMIIMRSSLSHKCSSNTNTVFVIIKLSKNKLKGFQCVMND